MRHSQLKAFHYVALHGGFSRAAEALFLTQPAISEQVRKLEQDHDVLLFHRERKRVQLTDAGERLFRLTNITSRSSSRSTNTCPRPAPRWTDRYVSSRIRRIT